MNLPHLKVSTNQFSCVFEPLTPEKAVHSTSLLLGLVSLSDKLYLVLAYNKANILVVKTGAVEVNAINTYPFLVIQFGRRESIELKVIVPKSNSLSTPNLWESTQCTPLRYDLCSKIPFSLYTQNKTCCS